MSTHDRRDLHRDPISGSPGSHPLGTGVGAAGGALAGGAIGALFGPIGILLGGTAGAIGGAAAGHVFAERVDPTGEAEYWRSHYTTRPYYCADFDFDHDYAPAYRYGSQARALQGERHWDEPLEQELQSGWEQVKAASRLSWE